MNVHPHTATPTLSVIDPRTLAVRSVGYCRHPDSPAIDPRITRQRFDAAGRLIESWDPRLWGTAPKPNLTTLYGLSGQPLLTDSVDGGWQLSLPDQAGSPCSFWDARGSQRHIEFDAQQRPITVTEQGAGELPRVVERLTYGDCGPAFAERNQCGQLIRHDDPAGSQIYPEYGMAPGVLREERRFLAELETPDWPLEPEARDELLETRPFITRYTFNPTGELRQQTDAMGNLRTFGYDLAGKPNEAWLQVAGEGKPPQCLVSAIRYNAQDQVERETAGNGVLTHAEYAADDGRLIRLTAAVGNQAPLQDLSYVYDAVGNIVELQDRSQPVTHFNNQRIDPINRYRYDSLYQLIQAQGWEVSQPSHGPTLPALLPTPLDPNQRRNYTQRFEYDRGGNLITRQHSGAPGFSMFTSALSNRSLAQREDGSLPGEPEVALGFDACGNQRELQRGQIMAWDSRNQLHQATLVKRETEPDDYECYRYDEPGHRLRKVSFVQSSGRTLRTEVRYLPGLEIHRQADGEEHHVISVEAGRSNVRALHWPQGEHSDQLRYSLSDHLGSSTLELDDETGVLTQEYYYPFGGTACWAGKSALVAQYKTIRYSGKERDATGLYYYGYRYNAPWLQRWISPDPSGSVDGLNVYRMVGNNSIKFVDEQGMVKGLSRFLSGVVSDSDAESARKAHFKTHLLPSILARKEDDKDFAILRIKKMAKVDDSGAAEELLKGAVEVLSKARMTFNISPDKLHELKGKGLGNRWEQDFKTGDDTAFRDGFETGMFDYANSPSKVIKEYGSTKHVKFNGKMRPVYGALKLSDNLSSAGGAMSYGTAAFYLPEETRKYMTFLGGDSFDVKPSVNNLAVSENMYPVFHRMESETWGVLSRVVAGQEAGLESPSVYIEWHSHNSVSWTGMTDLVFQSSQDLEKAMGHETISRFLKKNSIGVSSIQA